LGTSEVHKGLIFWEGLSEGWRLFDRDYNINYKISLTLQTLDINKKL